MIFLLLILFCLSGRCLAEEHTVLLYIAGSDLEEAAGAATGDLVEIMHTTENTPVRTVAYLGGSQKWWLPGLEDGHCYDLLIEQGEISVLKNCGVQNSLTEQAFFRFIKEYGSNGDDLILWGHGSSEIQGIGIDKLNDGDYLQVSEIRNAVLKSGLHFRMIGFDACNMAALEVFWALDDCTDYFAALSDREGVNGWNYRSILPCLEDGGPDAIPEIRKIKRISADRKEADRGLTVIKASELRECSPWLARLFDHTTVSSFPVSMEEIIRLCTDREAADHAARMLDGQGLTVIGKPAENTVLPAELPESYLSFTRRR